MNHTIQAAAVVLLAASAAHAQQAVQWRVEDGGNGHWYAVVPAVPGLNAALLTGTALVPGGRSASIASPAENEFLIGFLEASTVNGAWLGFFRSGSEDFRWADGSPVTWLGWGGANCGAGPYPNDGWAPGEVGVKLHDRTTDCGWNWDDIPFAWETLPIVAEWSADCNNDGIVDYGQILTGQLADTNTNGIPDLCEQPTCADADIYRDFDVNGADLGILLAQWGPNTPLTESDLNDDGVVNGADLGVLLSFWGPCPH